MVGRNSNWRCRPVFLKKVGGVLFGILIFLITNEVITMYKIPDTPEFKEFMNILRDPSLTCTELQMQSLNEALDRMYRNPFDSKAKQTIFRIIDTPDCGFSPQLAQRAKEVFSKVWSA